MMYARDEAVCCETNSESMREIMQNTVELIDTLGSNIDRIHSLIRGPRPAETCKGLDSRPCMLEEADLCRNLLRSINNDVIDIMRALEG
jgi:hypothetical protein